VKLLVILSFSFWRVPQKDIWVEGILPSTTNVIKSSNWIGWGQVFTTGAHIHWSVSDYPAYGRFRYYCHSI